MKRETVTRLLAEEEAKLASMGERGEPDRRGCVDRRGMRPDVGDLRAVRTGIGAALQALHTDVLHEEFPGRIADLLTQIDQQKDTDGGRHR